jgi:hypothetical protein
MLLGQQLVSKDAAERRSVRRFNMKMPASVRVSGIPSEFATQTENISARGLFFYLDRWMKEGAHVEVTMSLPPQLTLTEPVRVRLLARVLRVNHEDHSTRAGIAAAIEDYEFVRPRQVEESSGLEPTPTFSNIRGSA